jgi:hypothetical protein
MKIALAAVALTTVFATQADAQVARRMPTPGYQVVPAANQAFAQQRRSHSNNAAYDVYDTEGKYVGSDPDAHVRTELYFDRPSDY